MATIGGDDGLLVVPLLDPQGLSYIRSPYSDDSDNTHILK